MDINQGVLKKQIHFFKLNPSKKVSQGQINVDQSLSNISSDQRKFHQIIRHVLKDYQYFSGYKKQQLNLSEGERVLKTKGIKIVKQNDTYFIQKYIPQQQNLRKFQQEQTSKGIQFYKSECLTDPRYFLSMLGYSTKEKHYFDYLELQVYKCPSYGIEIVIYQKRDELQYVMFDVVYNYEGNNIVFAKIIQKLGDILTEENDIDPYTLRPRRLKHGAIPQQ